MNLIVGMNGSKRNQIESGHDVIWTKIIIKPIKSSWIILVHLLVCTNPCPTPGGRRPLPRSLFFFFFPPLQPRINLINGSSNPKTNWILMFRSRPFQSNCCLVIQMSTIIDPRGFDKLILGEPICQNPIYITALLKLKSAMKFLFLVLIS